VIVYRIQQLFGAGRGGINSAIDVTLRGIATIERTAQQARGSVAVGWRGGGGV
jgi:hypothetical protein